MSLITPCGLSPTTILRIWTLVREDLLFVSILIHLDREINWRPMSVPRALTTSQQNRGTI
jgi:hypothetical protein